MNRMRRSGSWLRKALAAAALAAPLFFSNPLAQGETGEGKLSRDLEGRIRAAGSDDLLPVIIQTVSDPSSQHLARLHGRGGAMKSRHVAIRGYSARVPAAHVQALSDDPEVTRISYDTPVRASLDVASRAVKADLALIDATGLDGRGVGVAVIDTGVASHLDLLRPRGASQVVEVEVVGHESGLADYFGHGTHVAGIIAGNGAASSDRYAFRTFRGLAPGAQIVSIRALHPDGTGSTSDILSAIDWVIRSGATYNIRVLNLSLGHPVYESYRTDPLCLAVRKAYDNGILVVVAAGNGGGIGGGFGTITTPGNEPTALTVGAMDDGNTTTITDDVLAWYSSRGPTLVDLVVKPDLVAPGTAVVSLRAAGSYLDTTYHQLTLSSNDYKNDPGSAVKDGDYYQLSGTSMATPMAAAAAALLFQKDPSLNPATVKARLMRSAGKDTRLVFETGAGYLDVQAALQAGGVTRDASSPRATTSSDGSVRIEDTGLIWGIDFTMSLIWGGGRVEGMTAVENNLITASGLIWSGERCSLDSMTGSVDGLGAIWTAGGKQP